LLDNSKLKISSPYLTSQVLLLSTKQYINETTGLNLVAVKSMKHLSNYFYEQFEVNHITWADKLEYCIGALEDNTADFAVVDYYSANKAMMIAGKEELLISQAINSKIEISLVISNDTDSRLMGILDNCIQYVSTMDAYEAVNMELSNQKSVFNLNAFLHEYSTVILLIALILTVAVTALIIILKSIFHRLSSIDKLTGCYNQTHFENIVPKILEEYTQRQYYIMIFDIYRFKYFIQYYGRKVGDDLLRSIASKVCNLLAGEEIMARTSENGFVVLVEEGNYLDLIQEFYFILDEVKSSFKLDISIKVNFGLYRIDDRNELVATMINKAILAQRMVRDNSDSMFAIYTDEMEKKLLTESRMEEEMKKALEEQEFKVFYQPKIDLKTKKIVGAEALIRWIKPDGTIVFPDQFIPVFERNGFIEQLDYYVLKEVSSYQMKRVKNNLSTFSISVNQSRYLLSNPQYVDNICKIMDEIGVPGQLIELEVTETLYIENHTLLVRVIKLLKERDIKFAIDDFGSGYSSLNLLTEMPADVLKIDREFLIDSDKSQQKKDVITKVVELAHMLNLDVVCEGVETKEQEEFLANISCDIAQGYYYSRPIPVDQFNLYVESNL
ncbi:putative bifunctional diguanylate cyclase/phosphodiesterase, partial [Anaerosporobacter sp.]|uniref:putative bifunctional diguanylate cyclase/phosphodiesterase n=1 Tax=Anaerosporobacter sp. TaxID=1872529 RepID=UPI00286EB646